MDHIKIGENEIIAREKPAHCPFMAIILVTYKKI
jgi:hypothetical protein